MNQSERHELDQIRKRLINLAAEAPRNVVYKKGSSAGSVASRIHEEVAAIAVLLNDGTDREEDKS